MPELSDLSSSMRVTANRFPAGTFTPAPHPSRPFPMLAAQTRLELVLLLRNGEQLLLTMLIPISLLIGFAVLPIGDLGESRTNAIVPGILALAIMSTAFTGQAIAVGFDRRYGALKRLGATALPKWAIIGGKSCAVVLVVCLQMALLVAIGVALGWRPSLTGLALAVPAVALGTVAFAAMGLFIGGWLRAEIVLALANILWFALAGIGSLVIAARLYGEEFPGLAHAFARITPSGALVESLAMAFDGAADVTGYAVLAAWAAACGLGAFRTFRWM